MGGSGDVLHQKEIYLGGEASQQGEQHVAGGGILHSSGHGSAIVFLFSFVMPIPPLLQFQKQNDFDEHTLGFRRCVCCVVM